MGWTLGRNLPVTSGRRALLSAAIVLSAMIFLLWVSRSADPGVALAAEAGADGNQETNERCFLAIPCWLSGGTPVGAQADGEQFNLTAQASGISLGSNGEQFNQETNERCFLAIPCWLSDGTPVGAQADGEQFTQAVQASGILLGSNGEENVERCLLPGIPCYQDSSNAQQFQSGSVQGTQELRTY